MARSGPPLTRLLILWLLSEAPAHGYRIKRILEDDSLRFWFPIEYASIYAVLRSHYRVHARGEPGDANPTSWFAATDPPCTMHGRWEQDDVSGDTTSQPAAHRARFEDIYLGAIIAEF